MLYCQGMTAKQQK